MAASNPVGMRKIEKKPNPFEDSAQVFDFMVVEMRGIEPLTSALRTLRSPN